MEEERHAFCCWQICTILTSCQLPPQVMVSSVVSNWGEMVGFVYLLLPSLSSPAPNFVSPFTVLSAAIGNPLTTYFYVTFSPLWPSALCCRKFVFLWMQTNLCPTPGKKCKLCNTVQIHREHLALHQKSTKIFADYSVQLWKACFLYVCSVQKTLPKSPDFVYRGVFPPLSLEQDAFSFLFVTHQCWNVT